MLLTGNPNHAALLSPSFEAWPSLFVCVGILYDRYHTRLQKPYGGLNYFMPIFSCFFLIFTLANISFPGTINFIGEFLVILGLFCKNILIGFFFNDFNDI